MPTKRKFTATFPTAKVKKIMQLDEEIGKISATVPSVVSCGVESLVRQLVTESYQIALTRNSRTVTASHLKLVVESHPEFAFLAGLVEEVVVLKPMTAPQSIAPSSSCGPCESAHNELAEESPVDLCVVPGKKRGRPKKTSSDSTATASTPKKKRIAKEQPQQDSGSS